jgi:hypothetical protein
VVLVVGIGGDVVGIVEYPAAFTQGLDVVVVAVLVEGDEPVGFIAGAEHLAAADVDLEDGRTAADGGRDGHVGHHVLLRAPREAREESADGLNAVLGISGEADDGIADFVGM